jgi:hypothetical protein
VGLAVDLFGPPEQLLDLGLGLLEDAHDADPPRSATGEGG